MRVLQIVRNVRHGGVPQHAYMLIRELAALCEVTVACQPGSWISSEMRSSGIPTVEVKMPGSILNPVSALRLANAARVHSFDVIHSHSDLCALYGHLAARTSGAKTVCTVHTLVPKSLRWTRRSDAMVAVSDATKRSLVSLGLPATDIHMIHNGTDVACGSLNREACRDRVCAEFGIPVRARLVIALGAINRIKGHDLLIEAAPLILKDIPDARFMIVGRESPDYNPVLEAIARNNGVTDRVVFVGHRHDALQLLAAADLVAMPSRWEPFGQVAIESMLVGTPVVASNVDGLPEVVAHGETGIIIPLEDVPALAAAVVCILSDPALARQFGEAGRQRVVELFSSRMMAEKTLALYSELFQSRRQAKAEELI